MFSFPTQKIQIPPEVILSLTQKVLTQNAHKFLLKNHKLKTLKTKNKKKALKTFEQPAKKMTYAASVTNPSPPNRPSG